MKQKEIGNIIKVATLFNEILTGINLYYSKPDKVIKKKIGDYVTHLQHLISEL